jgi:hypothetical protein
MRRAGGDSIDISFFEGSLNGRGCNDEDIDVDFEIDVPIVNNKFGQTIPLASLGSLRLEGTIANGVITGTILATTPGKSRKGVFSATPAQ